MRWQTTTALAVVLLLVGGFYYVYEVRWAPDRELAETRKGRVFSAEAADVTTVELKRREDTVRLTRAGRGNAHHRAHGEGRPRDRSQAGGPRRFRPRHARGGGHADTQGWQDARP